MELVYLWVEEYKNIKRQGFNFSSKFICDYDEENNKLTIKDNSEHIPDFFGENINVTAIVGKNGSGKSSISEMILAKVPYRKHKKYIMVSFDKKKEKYSSYGNIKDFSPNVNITTLDIDLASSGVEICANNNRNYNHNIVYINGLNLDFRTSKKYEYSDDENNIFIPKYIIQYKNNLNIFKDKIFFYTFDKVRFFLKKFKSEELIEDINEFSKKYKDNKKIYEKLISLDEIDSFDNTIKKLLIRFCSLNNVTREDMDAVLDIESCFKIKQEYYPGIPKVFDIVDALKYLKMTEPQESIDIQNNTRHYFECDIEDENLNKLWIFENFFDISSFIGTKKENLPVFDLELYDSKKDMTYNLLSNGEKQYMRLLIEIISNRSAGDLSSSIEPKLYFFDEVETSLHPEWQKKIFNDIYNIFQIWQKNVHLIFLTHSPFLLSDIPKQNIIFLDTYNKKDDEVKNKKQKIGNCKVLNHDDVLARNQTFGANIHTLLSDSFFMEDGLMGEFAKGKINDVYNFIVNHKTDKIKTKEEAQDIINIIGEPLIQRELQQLFDKKFELSNMTIDDEISLLERKLNALKKIQNDTN
ncbi:MAG: Unknown protein [uncultured Sulfurovum sp.]|uniref:AAA+ ATPase domain-containing protein n=1 Tax=uncultured Sulfurovum sp. TaxID=269237 RepID=A0A6S6S2M6_9BACT|nr:MAG: Unknown protein [uncultured Sulfurovum sp.]